LTEIRAFPGCFTAEKVIEFPLDVGKGVAASFQSFKGRSPCQPFDSAERFRGNFFHGDFAGKVFAAVGAKKKSLLEKTTAAVTKPY
jgi:hypothetical protein